jgi:hypothetical protein
MMMSAQEAGKTVLQVFAIALGLSMLAAILHKGYIDVAGLAQQHSGEWFWRALARYLIANLGG